MPGRRRTSGREGEREPNAEHHVTPGGDVAGRTWRAVPTAPGERRREAGISLTFGLHERPADWAESAPVRLDYRITLNAPPDRVFDLLADHERWPTWFAGMRRSRVDGPLTALGTLRTVWVGAARVQEHFVLWDRPRRLTLYVVQSNVPGMRVMAEDWRLAPADDRTVVTVTVGVETSRPLRAVPGLVRSLVDRSTRGAAGLTTVFESR